MAYTGTAVDVYVRLCSTAPSGPGAPALDCAWVSVPHAAFQDPVYDRQQIDDLLGALIWLFAIVFVIAMLKKAIEQ